MNTLETTDSIENCIELLKQGAQRLSDSAAMLARLVAKDPDTMRKIAETAPQVPASFLNRLLKVGEKALHPDLLLNGCPAYQRLALLPFSAQEAAIKAKNAQLVVNAETGDALRVPLVELTPDQVKQVIGPSGLRAKDEQQAYLRRKAVVTTNAAAVENIVGPSYQIRRDGVEFTRRCRLTRVELVRVLEEMVS